MLSAPHAQPQSQFLSDFAVKDDCSTGSVGYELVQQMSENKMIRRRVDEKLNIARDEMARVRS